jgi:hypothetical protein
LPEFTFSSKVARLDLNNFSPSGIDVLDIGEVLGDPTLHNGFAGGATDGRYGYISTYDARLLRLDLSDFATLDVLDLKDIYSEIGDNSAYQGVAVHGRYVYMVPTLDLDTPQGHLVRVDTTDFSTTEMIDLTEQDADAAGFSGAVMSGDWIFLAPYSNSKVARLMLANVPNNGGF